MRNILYILCVVALVSSCSGDLTELNKNPKAPETVPASSLITNAQVAYFDFLSSTSVNVNPLRLWSQQWAQVSYNEESNYDLIERNINGRTFTTLYSTVLKDLSEAKRFIAEDNLLIDEHRRNQNAMIDVMEVLAYTNLVDFFGDVPYSQALDPDNVTPAYDNDEDVYNSMIAKLDDAISNLGGSLGASGDVIYYGDGDSWKIMANTLKLKLAIRVADVNDAKAKQMASEAVQSGVMSSNADNFVIQYESSTPNTNPLWEDLVESGRSDYVGGNTMIDFLNELNDPRRQAYYKQNVVDSTGVVSYVGGIVGAVNSFTASSQIGAMLHEPTFPGTLISYTETLFLLADAVERNYISGSAADFYHMAISNSIQEWGGSQADADTYVAQGIVNYASAEGSWKEKIALQKYIAMYNNGFEAWSTFRLYDAPAMNLADIAGTVPPNRYTYPVNEYSINKANVEAAGSAMGGDGLYSKVFWDKN